MSWLTVSMEASAGEVEAVAAAMESLGALAVTTRPRAGYELLEPAPGEQPLAPRNQVTGLFEPDRDPARLSASLSEATSGVCAAEPRMETLEDADWEHAWRQHAEPRDFGGGLWVLPGDAAPPPGARTVVRLDPGLAFGTGSHPTTALCLSWLAAQELRGKTVIDYGCGSGILAIAAALLGARAVYAWDHDAQALDATRDNATRNGVAGRVLLTAEPPAGELLVSNILANALAELAPRFVAALHPGGGIGLSGVLSEQAPALAERYRGAFEMDAPRERDGWVLLTGRRRGAAAGHPCT